MMNVIAICYKHALCSLLPSMKHNVGLGIILYTKMSKSFFNGLKVYEMREKSFLNNRL